MAGISFQPFAIDCRVIVARHCHHPYSQAGAVRSVMADMLRDAAVRYGPSAAIAFPGTRILGLDEADALAGRFAGGLAALGITQGDPVLLHLPNGWQWVVAYHAIARLGAAVIPTNILNSPAEVSYMIAAGPWLLLNILGSPHDLLVR